MKKNFLTKKGNSKKYPNMVYIDPKDVNAPKDCILSKKIIFDGGLHSFSIAEVNWQGSICYGMRWNVSRKEWYRNDKINGQEPCYGMPFSTANPVWFIIPYITQDVVMRMIEEEEKRIKKEDFYY